MRRVLRCYERDIVRVRSNGKYQGFYRSTGRNSGSPGTWFPFDGISYPAWFIKDKYATQECKNKGLNRLGTEENKKISGRLAKENIKQGVESDEVEVNKFVGNKKMAKFWDSFYNSVL